jgi:hypothetical protein
MKNRTERRKLSDELGRKHDLSKLKGDVRGKYATCYQAGTNLVIPVFTGLLGDLELATSHHGGSFIWGTVCPPSDLWYSPQFL